MAAVLDERAVAVVAADQDGDLVPAAGEFVDLDEDRAGHPAAVFGRDSVGDHQQSHVTSLPDHAPRVDGTGHLEDSG